MSSAYYREKSGTCRERLQKTFRKWRRMKDNYIPQDKLTDETDIELIMS